MTALGYLGFTEESVPADEKVVPVSDSENTFFTLANGASQRLVNGNTLFANSEPGEAFEVTRDGETVWHFKNSNTDKEGKRSTIVRIKPYPAEWIDALLKKINP